MAIVLLFAVIVLLRAGAQLKCIGCFVPASCDVEHLKLAARGLLSFLRLLRAFLLHAINAWESLIPYTSQLQYVF